MIICKACGKETTDSKNASVSIKQGADEYFEDNISLCDFCGTPLEDTRINAEFVKVRDIRIAKELPEKKVKLMVV